MTFDEKTYQITVSQYDYGVPIVFDAWASQGFHDGETIVFCFTTDKIGKKEFAVKGNKYTFELFFDETEANNLYSRDIGSYVDYHYSIKRMKNGVFIDSLENDNGESIFLLRVKGTVKYNG